MKIGLVAPEKVMPEIFPFIQREFPDTEFIPFCYRSILELPTLLAGHQNRTDSLLFLGETARQFTEKFLRPAVPWAAVPRSVSSLLRLLFRAAISGRSMRIATDCSQEDLFPLAFREIGIPAENYSVHLCAIETYSEEHLAAEADRMASLCRTGNADFCITIFYRMQEMLIQRKVPVYILQPSFEDVRSGIERLLLSQALRENNHAPLACAAFRLSAPEEQYPADKGYELAAARLSAAQLIWQFARETQGACVERPPSGWLLFSTRALIESATDEYRRLPLLAQIRGNSPFTLSVGFGLGGSAEEAKLHAERALETAVRRGGDQAYLMSPNRSFPVPPARGEQCSQKHPVPDIREQFLPLAVLSGVSVRILTLLYCACRDMNRSRFTSAELADLTGVTPRTMNRILLKLFDKGLAREAGLRFTSHTGRPSRIIELLIRPSQK